MSLAEVRDQIATKIQSLIEDTGLSHFATSAGESDRWYWAAPLLLDRYDESTRKQTEEWLQEVDETDIADFFGTGKDEQRRGEASSKEKHFAEFRKCSENPNEAGLGTLPADLPIVLADMAIASPANVALRSFCDQVEHGDEIERCLLYTSPSPRDKRQSRMPSSA